MIAFEYHETQAAGKFNYTAIQTALRGLKQRLDAETEEWRLRGKEVLLLLPGSDFSSGDPAVRSTRS